MKQNFLPQLLSVFFLVIILLLQCIRYTNASIFTAGNPGEYGSPRSISEELDGSKDLFNSQQECEGEEENSCLMTETGVVDLRNVEGTKGFKLMNLSPEEKNARIERARKIRAKRLADEDSYRNSKALENDVHNKLEHDKTYIAARVEKEKEIQKKKEEKRLAYEKLKQEKLAKMDPEERAYYEEQLALEKKKKEIALLKEEENERFQLQKKRELRMEIERKLNSLPLDSDQVATLKAEFGLQNTISGDEQNILKNEDLSGLSKPTQDKLIKAMKAL